MRCRKCNQKAVINMRQHKLCLCREHFLEWVPQQTQRFIEKYNMFSIDAKVLVAVSGGKDSLALWEILNNLGYQVDGLHIDLGIGGGINYSGESKRLTQVFALDRKLKLQIVDLQADFSLTIPELAQATRRGQEKPCSVCGLVKRHIMNQVVREAGYDVLVTGHNLDDEAAVLFGNTMNWLGGYLIRQGPVLEATKGLVRKAKPLCRFYEREMAAYALLQNINYIFDECPYAAGAKSIYYKEHLNQLEADRPGAKLIFYLSFLRAKKEGLFALDNEAATSTLNTCSKCGQPTSAPDFCSFCKLIIKEVRDG
jgi:uncharacterized protein (TIGR00269 family)